MTVVHHRRTEREPEVHSLFKSISRNDLEGVLHLIRTKPNLIFERDRKGWSAVHYAARIGSIEIMKLLINSGAAIQVQDLFGMTPLAISFYHQNDGLALYLIDYIQKKSTLERSQNQPPLPDALDDCIIQSCSFLPEVADPSTEQKGLSARWCFAEGVIACEVRPIDSKCLTRRLTTSPPAKSDSNSRSIQKALVSAAVIAVCEDQLQCLQYLMDDASFRMSARKCASLALIAVSQDSPECLRWLLNSPSMAAWRGWGNQSLLHIAAKNGSVNSATVLVEISSASLLYAVDDQKETPFDKALQQHDVLKLLQAQCDEEKLPTYRTTPNPFIVRGQNDYPEGVGPAIVNASALFGTKSSCINVWSERQKLFRAHQNANRCVIPECARIYCNRRQVRSIQRRMTTVTPHNDLEVD